MIVMIIKIYYSGVQPSRGAVGQPTDDLFVWVILTILFSTCSLYQDKQNSANGYGALLLRQIARDPMNALSHGHDNTLLSLW